MTRLSPSLQPIVDLELKKGNKVFRIDKPAGSKCPYAIIFKFPLHFQEIKESLTLSSVVEEWENKDPHYPLERGFFCNETQHSIAGPSSGEFSGRK